MKKNILITLILLIFINVTFAANKKWTQYTELTAIDDADVLLVVDDVAGTPTSKKITVLNLFDTIDTFAELNTIVADKTLVNEEDAVTWDALGTFGLGLTITTGDPFTLGANRIDNGSDLLDGEMIGADTIDVDSLDWGAFTDLGEGGSVTWGNIAEGELTNASVVDADIKDDTIQEPALNTTNAAGAGTDNYLLSYNHAGTNFTWVATGAGDLLADGSVPMTANWDIGNYDITLKSLTGDGTIEGATITEGGNAVWNATETEIIDSDHYVDASIDLVHLASGVYAKDIVTTSPITGGTDNVLVGADSDVTIAVTVAKDIVTTAPLTGGTDNILPGSDSDITIALDFTASWDFGGAAGFELPNAAAPTTNATGEVALDTTITDHQPLFQYYDGGENMTVIAIDTAQLPAEDNEIVKYDAGTDKFVLEADSGGGGATAWDDIGDPDAAATVDFVTYTQTIDIGKSDSGGGSGLILDVTGLGAGTDDVIALEITTAADDDSDYIPLEVRDDSGTNDDLLFQVNYQGVVFINETISFGNTAEIYGDTSNYIKFSYNEDDYIDFYYGGTDLDIIWSDGALNLRNNEDDVDAIVEIEGKDAGEKGILRVLSDGDDKYIELYHDDTDSYVSSSSGDLYLVAVGGDIQCGDENINTTGNVLADGNLSVGNAGTTAGVLTLLEDDDDGAHFASFMVPALAANTVYTLPPDDGDDTEVLQTNGTGTLTWVANAGSATAWDDIGDADAAGSIDFVTNTQTLDIGKSDSGGGSGLILDVTGLGAGTDDVIALEITTSTDDDTDYVPIAIYDDSGSENDLLFSIDSAGGLLSAGVVTASSFAGVGSSITGVDAATGDSATAFFDAGTIEHEWGGLQADISGYTGLIAITGADTTAEIDSLDELEGQLADVTRIVSESIMPVAGTDPDVDAPGELSVDTDGANEPNDVVLRTIDGNGTQVALAQEQKSIQATIVKPNDLADATRDACPIWSNETGMSFIITKIEAWSDTDDTTLNVEEEDADGANNATIDALEIATDGTGMYYTTETTITGATVEANHLILLDFDDTDAPGWVKISICGYFLSDVD